MFIQTTVLIDYINIYLQKNYLGVFIYKPTPIAKNMILGNQTASNEGIDPFIAKVEDIVENRI